MSRGQKPVYLEIAPTADAVWPGCIERMSTVPQGRGPECSRPSGGVARVAWRALGACDCGVGVVCGYCEWQVSCRTPRALRGGLVAAARIGDGSAEAAAAWVRGET